MGSWTIKAINSGPREWTSKAGHVNLSYRVDLVNDADGRLEGDVELTQKKTTPAPQVGQTLEGDVETGGQYGAKFKKAQGGGARQGGGGGRPRDPAERASIERQVAFKGAVELVVAMKPEGMGESGIESTLTRLFEFGVGLIQGQQATPPPQTQQGQGTINRQADHRANGTAVSAPPARDAALEDLRNEYAKWKPVAGDNHASIWANKLTSLGLADVNDASEDQINNLLEWLRIATRPSGGPGPTE